MDAKRRALRKKIESAVILTAHERMELLERLSKMTEDEMSELEHILLDAEKINWEKDLPEYERAVEEAIALSEETEGALRSLSPSL